MTLRYGIIGCGRISPNHIQAARSNGLVIAALCDTDERARTAAWASLGASAAGVHLYRNHREMLAAETLELVAVCTPSGLHATIALDCIDAGVNLIIEKPLALSLADADAIIRRSDLKGIRVCACHQNRFNRSIVAIRKALDTGRFGSLLYGTAHIRWNRSREYYEQAPWRGTWSDDGGALMNQCIHNIDLLRWMMGDEATEVFAYTDRLAHDYLETEDFGLALIRFANGSYGLIEGTTDVYPTNLEETLYLFGSTGTAKAGGKSVNRIEAWRFADASEGEEDLVIARTAEDPANVYGFGHTPLYADIIEAIKQNRPPAVDARAGRRALELVLAIYKSSRDGAPVKLPLEDFSTLDMVGSF